MNGLPSVASSSSLAVILDAVGELASFARNKALYESDCRLREKAAEIRSALFAEESSRNLSDTKELAKCKMKLALLKECVMSASQSARQLLAPLVNELETRIEALRVARKHTAAVL